MNIKKALLITLLFSVGSCVHAEAPLMQQPVVNQEQISEMMNRMYDLMMPDFKKVYKKYFDEIEWLEHFYVTNQATGNALILTIAQEFADILAQRTNEFTDIMFDEMSRDQEMPAVSAEEKAMFNNVVMQIMPNVMVQGLKKNAELKSSVYQEIMTERQ